MAKKLFSRLVTLFGRRQSASDAELLSWAKTEYGKDWYWAYAQMKKNPGKVPYRGVTL